MDKDGSLQVEWNEWRDYHFLNPHSHNITDILKFWKHSVVRTIFLQFNETLLYFCCLLSRNFVIAERIFDETLSLLTHKKGCCNSVI